jgi:hypothetical protein
MDKLTDAWMDGRWVDGCWKDGRAEGRKGG